MARAFFKKLGAMGIGYLLLELVNYTFDWPLYIWVINRWGPYKGGVIMTILAFGLNYIFVLIYNRTKVDWLGFEWLRLQQETESKTRIGRFIRFFLGRRMRWVVAAYLSYRDPFKAFVFLRGRISAQTKFTAADWKLLFGVNFVGNLIWVVTVYGVLEVIKKIF